MKNYRESIYLAIFFGNDLIATISADAIKFTTSGDVFLYSGGFVVGHVTRENVDKLRISKKWVHVSRGASVFHINYWLDV